MIRLLGLILVLGYGLATSMLAHGQQSTQIQFKRADIMDPSGFAAPVRYAVSLIPADWTTQGGIVWVTDPNSCINGSRLGWSASAPDESVSMGALPGIGWQANSFSGWKRAHGCAAFESSNPDEIAAYYVHQAAQQAGTAVNIVDIQHDPAHDHRQTQILNTSLGGGVSGIPQNNRAVTRVAEFTYEVGGRPYRGFLLMNMTIFESQIQGTSTLSGSIYEAFYFGARADKFDASLPILEAFMRNFQLDPAWKIAKWRSDAAFAASQPRPSSTWKVDTTGSDILDIQMQGYLNRTAIRDGGQADVVDTIRGVTTYGADTPTGQVQVPSGYDQVWQLPNGNIVASNDPFYDGQGEGTELQQLRR